MHPNLLGGRRRPIGQVPRRSSLRGLAVFSGFAAIVVASAATGAGFGPVAGASWATAPTASPPPATMLTGIDVPAPSADADLSPIAVRSEGRYRFGSDSIGSLASQELFGYYLAQMSARSWQLISKGDPDSAGWTQYWRRGEQVVLLTFVHRPTARLTIDACPPRPYC